jgi:hypothetical protein
VKRNSLEVIKGIDQKFMETDWVFDTFSPDLNEDFKFVRNLRCLFYMNNLGGEYY